MGMLIASCRAGNSQTNRGQMARHRHFVSFLKVGHGLYYRTPYLSPITQVPWSACDPLYPVCDRLQTGSEFPLSSFPCFHFDGWSVDHYLSNILRTVWGQFAHISWKLKVARILDGYYSLIRGRPPLGVEQLLLTSNGLEKCLRWRNYRGCQSWEQRCEIDSLWGS